MDKFTRKDSKRESKRRRSDASEGSSNSSAVSLNSFSSGSSDGSVTVDTSTPTDLWSFQERPPHSKQVSEEEGVCREKRHFVKRGVGSRFDSKRVWQVYFGQFFHPTVNRLECVCVCVWGGGGVKIETLFVNRGVALPHVSLELSRESTPLLAS